MHKVVESGICWVSRWFTKLSSLRHLFRAVVSVAVGVANTVGGEEDPSKWDHSSLASTVTWKRKTKIAQFIPLTSNLGTLDGSVSVVIGTVVDMMSSEFFQQV